MRYYENKQIFKGWGSCRASSLFVYFTSSFIEIKIKGGTIMDNKIIVHAMNGPKRNSYGEHGHSNQWAELMFLYEDGTWEKIFEYRWNDPWKTQLFNTGRITGITRAEAIIKLEKDYYSGKLEGIFMDER
jgi:hypothetical protein